VTIHVAIHVPNPITAQLIAEKAHSVRRYKQIQTKYKRDTKNPVLLKYGVFQAL